jgi:hypothetical protein
MDVDSKVARLQLHDSPSPARGQVYSRGCSPQDEPKETLARPDTLGARPTPPKGAAPDLEARVDPRAPGRQRILSTRADAVNNQPASKQGHATRILREPVRRSVTNQRRLQTRLRRGRTPPPDPADAALSRSQIVRPDRAHSCTSIPRTHLKTGRAYAPAGNKEPPHGLSTLRPRCSLPSNPRSEVDRAASPSRPLAAHAAPSYGAGCWPLDPLERTRDATSRLARAGDASNSTATDGQGE